MAKRIEPDVERFLQCKSRVNDLYEHCGDTIRAKKTVRAAANVFVDMKWLIDEINRLPGSELIDLKRFTNIAKQVTLICKERAPAIRTGQFVDMSAEVFARYRFLVRELEKVILSILDEEEAAAITGEKLVDENENRVKIDLTDPDDPDDDVDDPDGTDVEKRKKLTPV
jgi:hypothetical protein